MRRRHFLLLVVAALGVVTTACASDLPVTDAPAPAVPPDWGASRTPSSLLSISTGNGEPATLRVDVADDDAERTQGLMGVEELPEDQGMAFVWDELHEGSFWMKDTLIPLSVAFWDADGRIVAILDMEPCRSDTCLIYSPGRPFIGAVEANLGWFEERGVAVGDEVQLEVRADA